MTQLEEGKEYLFLVEKLLKLPDADYFILIDEWERKYLLPQVYYQDYPIEAGKYITCNVNKINCNGKIFLEPRHPVYKIGDEDRFEIYQLEQRIKQKSKEPYYVILARNEKTDKAAVLNYTVIDGIKLPVNKLCRVVKIKKAEVMLEIV